MNLEIIDYGMNGEGVAKLDGKIVLIPNALVGEIVDVEITSDKGNYCYAKVKNIIKPSEQRSTPACPYYSTCGGCDLQHMQYQEQLKFKQQLVKKTIKKICNLDVEVDDTIHCSSMFGYRNKISINNVNNVYGYFKSNTKDIVNIDNCLLANQNINSIYKLCREYCISNQLEVKNIVIRQIAGQTLIGIVSKKQLNLSELAILLKQYPNVGLYNILNSRNDSVVLSGKAIHIYGIKEIEISNFGLSYTVDLLGFHQTNEEIQNKLYKKVIDFVGSKSVIANGFSGQGLLSSILCSKAKKVIGIEINQSAHNSAEKLKKGNNITNLRNIKGDFNKEIEKLKNIDLLILDPAKKGCGKETMQKLIGIKEIIYISCNPIALCKDLNVIVKNYEIEQVTPFDMFPNTKNVETLVKLKLKEN